MPLPGARSASAPSARSWRSRTVRTGEEAPDQLLAHPDQEAPSMRAVLPAMSANTVSVGVDTAGPLGRPLPGDPMRYCPGCRRPVPPPRTHCGPCLARAWVRGS